MTKIITIHKEYITLSQFLKMINYVDSGGHAKQYLTSHTLYVNEIPEDRRGRKLKENDEIILPNQEKYIIKTDK